MFDPSENLEETETVQELSGDLTHQRLPPVSTQTELSKSFYERYFLHYGVKAAATIQLVGELLECREQGTQDADKVFAKYEVGGEPLSFSIKPAIAELCLSEDALVISKKYWGDSMKLPAARLPILPSDFISPMGYGVNIDAQKVPPKIFVSSWRLSDLLVSEKLGAILYASFALWERCYQKLETLKNSPDQLPPIQQQEVDVVNNKLKNSIRGEFKESVLFLGQVYFNKIDPSLKSRFDRTSSAIKSGGDIAAKQIRGNLNSDNRDPEQSKSVARVVGPTNQSMPEDPFSDVLRTSRLPNRPKANPAKKNIPIVRHSENVSSVMMTTADKEKVAQENVKESREAENKLVRRYPSDRVLVDTWIKKGDTIYNLAAKLRVAFQEGSYVVAKLSSGPTIQGIPVVGGRRMDFFTIINEEAEATFYPKYIDVRRLDIFKFK